MEAFIAIDTTHGTILEIGLMHNGHPDHVKPILLNHYNTPEKILSLVGKGKLHVLGESNESPTGHSYDTPIDGHCVYYGRDRGDGERFNLVYFFGSHDPISNDRKYYQYMYKDNEWIYKANGPDEWSKLI